MKVGDLVFDIYHSKYGIVVDVWGSKKTGRYVKLHQGYKAAAGYVRVINGNP